LWIRPGDVGVSSTGQTTRRAKWIVALSIRRYAAQTGGAQAFQSFAHVPAVSVNAQFSAVSADTFFKLSTKRYDRHHEKWL
jgi:hypothetical protein